MQSLCHWLQGLALGLWSSGFVSFEFGRAFDLRFRVWFALLALGLGLMMAFLCLPMSVLSRMS